MNPFDAEIAKLELNLARYQHALAEDIAKLGHALGPYERAIATVERTLMKARDKAAKFSAAEAARAAKIEENYQEREDQRIKAGLEQWELENNSLTPRWHEPTARTEEELRARADARELRRRKEAERKRAYRAKLKAGWRYGLEKPAPMPVHEPLDLSELEPPATTPEAKRHQRYARFLSTLRKPVDKK